MGRQIFTLVAAVTIVLGCSVGCKDKDGRRGVPRMSSDERSAVLKAVILPSNLNVQEGQALIGWEPGDSRLRLHVHVTIPGHDWAKVVEEGRLPGAEVGPEDPRASFGLRLPESVQADWWKAFPPTGRDSARYAKLGNGRLTVIVRPTRDVVDVYCVRSGELPHLRWFFEKRAFLHPGKFPLPSRMQHAEMRW